MDKVTPIRSVVKEEVIAALEEVGLFAQESQPSGVIVIMVSDGRIHTWYNEGLRAESVVAMCEVVKSGAVEALSHEETD